MTTDQAPTKSPARSAESENQLPQAPDKAPTTAPQSQYRGMSPDGTTTAPYNWFDATGKSSSPVDTVGQGAHVVATAVGAYGTTIGVAPDAKFIAARSVGQSPTMSELLKSLQWMAAPTRPDGSSPNPKLGVDVLSMPQRLPGRLPRSLNTALRSLAGMGTVTVFPAGEGAEVRTAVGAASGIDVSSTGGIASSWRDGKTGRGVRVGAFEQA